MIEIMPAADCAEKACPYQFKPGPWSSHGLLLAALPPSGEGRRVLDLGCGPGYLGALLAGRGYRVTGVEAPGRTGSDFPSAVELVHADLDAGLPPLASRYDHILCADVLEHLRDPGRLLAQLHSVLAPGGRILASLPNSGHAYFRWTVLRGRFPAQDRGLFDRTHLHFYTWSGWRELFAAAGFQIESVAPTGVPVGLALPRWENSSWVRMLERISYTSARVWMTMFAYQFVVKVKA